MHEINSLIGRLKAHLLESSGPFLLVIDGRSATGKSTLAQSLNQQLDATMIHGDDFFARGAELLQASPEALAEMCIDRERLGSVLQAFKSGQSAQYRPFDWVAFDGSLSDKPITVEPGKLMILEGVYSNHPDFRQWIDHSVLLCLPETERERRLLEREGEITDWERQWHRAEDWYFEHLAQPECFNFVLGNG